MADLPIHPTETTRAAASFAQYVAMGEDRSLDKLAKLLYGDTTKTTSKRHQLAVWSSKFAWVTRSQQYDSALRAEEQATRAKAEADRIRRKALREEKRAEQRERMDDNRASIFGNEWARVLKLLNERIEKGDIKGLVGLTTLLKTALDEERLALGGATAVNEQRLTGKDGEELTGLTIITMPIANGDDSRYVQHGYRPIVDADEL